MARFFKEEGACVLDADRLAHEVFRKDNRLHLRVRSLFPEFKGRLHRSRIAEVVFKNPRRRRTLESLIHPYVFDRIQEEVRRARRRMVVVEVPLLFESGFDRRCDRNIVVQSSREKVFERLLRKGYSKKEILARWRAQIPPRGKIRRADFVIDNSNGFNGTRRQVVQIWNQIQI